MNSLQQAPTVGQQVPPQAVIDGAIEQHVDQKRETPYFPPRKWRKDAQAKRLRYSPDRAGWRLPFVEVKNKQLDRYWTVPATSDYVCGYKVGEKMAIAYLKQLRGDEHADSVMLQDIVLSFAKRLEDAGGVDRVDGFRRDDCIEAQSLKGHVCGFFGTLTKHLARMAKGMPGLDSVSESEILTVANGFLGGRVML